MNHAERLPNPNFANKQSQKDPNLLMDSLANHKTEMILVLLYIVQPEHGDWRRLENKAVVVVSFYLKVGQWKNMKNYLDKFNHPWNHYSTSLFNVAFVEPAFCHVVLVFRCLTWGWNNYYTTCHDPHDANYDLLHPGDSSYAECEYGV